MVVIEFRAKFNALLIILGLLLLTQFTLGNVLSDRKPDVKENQASRTYDSKKDVVLGNSSHIVDVECKESLPKEHFEKFEKLRIFAFEQLNTFGDYLLHALKNLFAKIIEEGSSKASLKAKLEQFKKLHEELINVENINNPIDKFDRIDDAVELLDQYNLTKIKNPTKEAELIADILKKLNLETLINQCDEKGKEFKESFISKAEEYKKSLTPEERTNGKSFDDWLTKFKNVHNDLLSDYIVEFFELYCLVKK